MKKFSLIRFIAFLMLVSSLYSQEDPSSNEGLAIFIDLIESSDGSGIAIVAPRYLSIDSL
ncbi:MULTISPECIES: hypothetical protein [Parachlamydia]|uniref:Serine protease n=1 Tax=Parachlamydia acanthamoebae (strain UV7) TaxID=765952 RepID=F8L062_PARAV|nr:hypothetical protein [Parachlamydia acanthamoebae]CCB86590.1 unknown protein [Parachlamydia acanthamoebae UV-7]